MSPPDPDTFARPSGEAATTHVRPSGEAATTHVRPSGEAATTHGDERSVPHDGTAITSGAEVRHDRDLASRRDTGPEVSRETDGNRDTEDHRDTDTDTDTDTDVRDALGALATGTAPRVAIDHDALRRGCRASADVSAFAAFLAEGGEERLERSLRAARRRDATDVASEAASLLNSLSAFRRAAGGDDE